MNTNESRTMTTDLFFGWTMLVLGVADVALSSREIPLSTLSAILTGAGFALYGFLTISQATKARKAKAE